MGPRKPVTVKLVGGIGNQLFGYYAGLSLSKRLGESLRLDVTDSRMGLGVHKSSIEVLNLPGEFYSRAHHSTFVKQNFSRGTAWIKRKRPRLNLYSSEYVSPVVGFDGRILEPNFSKRKIAGYFQSYRYHDLCPKASQKPEIQTPSSWFVEMQRRIKDSQVISLHVRRGDYRSLSSSFGLLSDDYYIRALEIADEVVQDSECWVFTDEINEAKSMFSKFDKKIVFIDPPPSSNPVESLLLMSYAKANIIANSTFSWWSAKLNHNSQLVVAPSKWFRDMEDPLDLYPVHWTLEESSWISI